MKSTQTPAPAPDPCARANRYTDVMIDIEALADLPDSAPAEIALVFFDRDHPDKPFCSYRHTPSPMSAMRMGFSITAATLQWWDDHDMTIAVQQGAPLLDVLDEITADIRRHTTNGLRVWSRGNSYDLAILKLAYHRGRKKFPWDFWNERDVRTWLESFRFKSPRRNNHTALDDANNQALDVVEATALGSVEKPKTES
jgi:exodeoxyribonuclease VIII